MINESDGLADAARGYRMVSGHHHDPYAGASAIVDRARYIRARRVFQSDKPDENEPLIRRAVSLSVHFHGAGEYAQAVMPKLIGSLQPFGAHALIQFNVALIGDDAMTHCYHRFRRSFDGDKKSVAADMHSRHHLGTGFERMLSGERMPAQ